MNINRIKVSLLHTWYHFSHSMETWVDIFWNSSLQMAVYAFIATVFTRGDNPIQGAYMIAGMLFWNILWSAQYGIAVGVLWEIWSHSLSSLFITPLTLEEFLVGQAISSAIKAVAAVIVTTIVATLIFQFSLFQFGWYFLFYFVELLVFGWAMGMVVLSLIFRWGTDVQSLSWSIVFLVQPFGAVFYPVDVLPEQIRPIAYAFPTTYIFESIRGQLRGETVEFSSMALATILNVLFLIGGYLLMRRSYIDSKKSGAFSRLEG